METVEKAKNQRIKPFFCLFFFFFLLGKEVEGFGERAAFSVEKKRLISLKFFPKVLNSFKGRFSTGLWGKPI